MKIFPLYSCRFFKQQQKVIFIKINKNIKSKNFGYLGFLGLTGFLGLISGVPGLYGLFGLFALFALFGMEDKRGEDSTK